MGESTMKRVLWRRTLMRQKLCSTVTGMMCVKGLRSCGLDNTSEKVRYQVTSSMINLSKKKIKHMKIKILYVLAKRFNLRQVTERYLETEIYAHMYQNILMKTKSKERQLSSKFINRSSSPRTSSQRIHRPILVRRNNSNWYNKYINVRNNRPISLIWRT